MGESDIRLVRRMQSHDRHVPPEWTKRKDRLVGFADAFPCLLASEESLQQVNEWSGRNFTMSRFRPNFIVKGLSKPFEEDEWKVNY